jgi:uncharacterized membrane protein YgcG
MTKKMTAMKKANPMPSVEELLKGLEIIELEERLEMVHLSAVEAEASWKCDAGGSDAPAEEDGTFGGGESGGGGAGVDW